MTNLAQLITASAAAPAEGGMAAILIGIGRLYTAVLKTEGKGARREGAAAAAKG